MATPTLEELFTQLTREQIEASALDIATRLELPVTAWEEGSVGREIIVILCELMGMYLSGASSTASAAGFLDYARGEWLALTGSQVFDTEQIEATFATCTVRLTNASLVPYTPAADDLRFGKPSGGAGTDNTATYVNTQAGSLPAWSGSGAYPVLDLAVICENSGTVGNAAPGTITEMVTPLAGVTCTNTTPAVGTDEESRTAYILRCREAVARLSPNGPADAYNYFAKSTVRGDGSNCGVTRTRVVQPPLLLGIAYVYLASDAGAVEPSDVALVQTNLLENCVPTGFTVSSVSAVAYEVEIQATIYLQQGSTASSTTVIEAVLESLQDYIGRLPIGGVELVRGSGGFLFLDMIIAELVAGSDQIVQAVVTNLSNDLSVAENQVVVLTSSTASFNVVQT